MTTPEELFERLLTHVLNGQDRAYYRAEFRRAMLAHDSQVIEEYVYGSEDSSYDWRDGSDPSDDAPKAGEPLSGSKMRPEGMSAGAQWLQDWRLP